MKNLFYSVVLVSFLLLNTGAYSQTVHDVSVSNFSFTPAQLTIQVGDVVRWTNVSGTHNVVADDNSFTSGSPSSTAWVYEHTFSSAGSNPYYCSLHGGVGGVGMSGVVTVEAATDVNDNDLSVKEFKLEQNYPNPFNPSTTINYQVPAASNVVIKIYNVLGKEVATLLNEEKTAGRYSINFDATSKSINLSSGVYFYRMQAGDFVDIRKMILMR